MDIFKFRIGELDCWSVSDGTYSFPATNFFANADAAELESALLRHGITDGRVVAPFCCFVVRTAGRTVLIDTGFGAGAGPATGQLPANLGAAGFSCRDVDVVVLPHGHADHAGGTLDPAGRLVFPNARHLINRAELDFWFSPESAIAGARGELARKKLEILRGHVEFYGPGDEFLPGLRAIPAPGHTPHNLAIEIRSGGQTALYVADAIAHPIHVERPDWYPNADLDPAGAVATRRQILKRAADENLIVCAYHMPFPGVCFPCPRWRPFASACDMISPAL
jgi:glyoxylase-like metal-dependent hydrolase (beta-lactamase superfamily II)